VNRQKAFDALQFDDQAAIDNEIETIADIEIAPFVAKWQLYLTLDSQSDVGELDDKALLVRRFKQPRS